VIVRLVILGLLLLGRAGPAQQPNFNASVDAVVVDVAVTRAGKPVADLTARDFRLTDNGVVQTVSDVSRETLPVDVTVVADISGSREGPLLDSFRRGFHAVRQRLRPDDRAELILFDPRIQVVPDLERSHVVVTVEARNAGGGSTALLDALAAALIRPAVPARRRMAIVFTSGQDAGSFLDEPDLLEVAARSGVAVFAVTVTDGTSLVPQRPANPAFLGELTGSTGGAFVALQRDQDLGTSFVQALDEFRTSYVLRYMPTAPAPGWHVLGVSVARPGPYEVRARKGYFRR
jgi:VWFA-related protein